MAAPPCAVPPVLCKTHKQTPPNSDDTPQMSSAIARPPPNGQQMAFAQKTVLSFVLVRGRKYYFGNNFRCFWKHIQNISPAYLPRPVPNPRSHLYWKYLGYAQYVPYYSRFRTVYCTVLYCTVLYCTVLYCTVLYCTVLYCTRMWFCRLSRSGQIVRTTDENHVLYVLVRVPCVHMDMVLVVPPLVIKKWSDEWWCECSRTRPGGEGCQGVPCAVSPWSYPY